MNLSEKVEHILAASLEHQGYAIVRVQVSGNVRKTVQIMIEKLDHTEITIEDCERVSRHASVLLDVEDPFPFAYVLEVSSPGLDRPLVKPKDFERFSGKDIKLHLTEILHHRKRFIAHLNHANDMGINVTVKEESAEEDLSFDVFYHQILSAKLHVDFGHSIGKKGKASGTSKG